MFLNAPMQINTTTYKKNRKISVMNFSCSTENIQLKSATQQQPHVYSGAGFIKVFLFTLMIIVINNLHAQTNYIQTGLKDYDFLDRFEIKTRLEETFYSSLKPYSRKAISTQLEMVDSILQADPNRFRFTDIDKYNLQNELMMNSEWTKPRSYYTSTKPVFNAIYKTKSNLLEVNTKDLYLVLNPVVTFSAGLQGDSAAKLFQNTRGLYVRGMIAKKVGFHLYFADNQERDPMYVNAWGNKFNAVPGTGFYKQNNNTLEKRVDYFDARGSVSWNVAKFIDMQLGFDKHFIGNGYRSLYLSDFSQSMTFFKINTRIWKFDYQNLYFELYPYHKSQFNLAERKYARINYLSMNVNKWLNVGIFESVVFARTGRFDFQYILPVMFIRPAESNAGSSDNAMVGFDAKANIVGRFQLYGQLLLDELKVKEVVNGNKWWGNKQGVQLGLKYVDALGLKNVDLQVETNYMRPFTYSHFDSISNYTHYNQPMAHPLGANFKEYIFIVKAQPARKLYLRATAIHYIQGLDSFGVNYGSNIFRDYDTRPREYGYSIGDGIKATCNMLQLVASYEITHNMFIDATALYRTYKTAVNNVADKTKMITIGLRWNVGRRDFLF